MSEETKDEAVTLEDQNGRAYAVVSDLSGLIVLRTNLNLVVEDGNIFMGGDTMIGLTRHQAIAVANALMGAADVKSKGDS